MTTEQKIIKNKVGLLELARERFETVACTLRAFCGLATDAGRIDGRLRTLLGNVTDTKRWLAMSLAKTIALQLDPPAEMQAASALDGPAWIKQ